MHSESCRTSAFLAFDILLRAKISANETFIDTLCKNAKFEDDEMEFPEILMKSISLLQVALLYNIERLNYSREVHLKSSL